jgi:ABC-type sugar transport system permease subunit
MPKTLTTKKKILPRFIIPYFFLAPFFLLFGIFMGYPVVAAVLTSFHDADLGTSRGWIGFANFEALSTDPLFHAALANTAFFVVVSLLVIFPISLLLALLVRPLWVKGGAVFRVLLVAPAVVVPVVTVIIFQIILGPNGLLNSAIRTVFADYESIAFLSDPAWARWGVALMFVWRWTGFTMIYFLAGLSTVSSELEEASVIDGANRWQQFWSVTWPQLHAIRILVLVLILQGSAQIFDEPNTVAGGDGPGPERTLITLTMYVYSKAFKQSDTGQANAAAIILLLAVVTSIGIALFMNPDRTKPSRLRRVH